MSEPEIGHPMWLHVNKRCPQSCPYCDIAELEQRIHDAYEVYAGMDGVMPESDKEVYLMRCITQMARELEKGE